MALRPSAELLYLVLFCLFVFCIRSLMRITRQRKLRKFTILGRKPQSHVRILLISNIGYSLADIIFEFGARFHAKNYPPNFAPAQNGPRGVRVRYILSASIVTSFYCYNCFSGVIRWFQLHGRLVLREFKRKQLFYTSSIARYGFSFLQCPGGGVSVVKQFYERKKIQWFYFYHSGLVIPPSPPPPSPQSPTCRADNVSKV